MLLQFGGANMKFWGAKHPQASPKLCLWPYEHEMMRLRAAMAPVFFVLTAAVRIMLTRCVDGRHRSSERRYGL